MRALAEEKCKKVEGISVITARGSPLRIVHIVGYFMPEVGYEEYFLAKEQLKLGHNVAVLTSDRPLPHLSSGRGERLKVGREVLGGLEVVRLKALGEFFYDMVLAPGLRSALEELSPDVVHLHEPKHLFGFPAALKRRRNYGLVMDIHDFDYPDHPIHREIRGPVDAVVVGEYVTFRRLVGRAIFKRADHIVAVIPACRDFLEDFYKVKGPPVTVTGLGADTEMFHYTEKGRRRIREMYSLEGREVLIFSGVITRRKRLEDVLEVFSSLAKENPNLRLMVVGDGPEDYLKMLKVKAEALGISERVIFTGFIPKERLKEYFSAADIGVWLSNNSINQLEAMACRLPVVVPELQLSFIFKQGGALLFPPGEKDAFKKALVEILADEERREALGREGEKLVRERYSYSHIAGRLVEIYQSVMEKRR
ncbi:MAG: glycosyltransferase family 4 protein [Thermoplasmata archaeon]|nr:glycosyltransferase family 4 protein [Thermoplasmata archaeon]